MTHIVFVDDDPSVLDGLRRMLRGLRNEWDMEFAHDGAGALEILDRTPCDVIVTDMRMPGMDGAVLLDAVRVKHPQVIRIVLSGQADRNVVFRAVEPTHQYLSKPCDADTLKMTIARACALRDVFQEGPVKHLVAQVKSLPSVPQVYHDVLRLLRDPDSNICDVGELISQDVAMTAKVLKIVNSAFFGLPRAVETPAQAAIHLGIDTLKSLVLSMGVFAQYETVQCPGFDLNALVEHSVQVGQLVRRLGKDLRCDKTTGDNAFMAGLLHDVGKLVLATHLPAEYMAARAEADASHSDMCDHELSRFGVTHADVGAYLLGLWGLPEPLVEATLFHHAPSRCVANDICPLTLVHVANVLVHRSRDERGAQVDAAYLDRVGLGDWMIRWEESIPTAGSEA